MQPEVAAKSGGREWRPEVTAARFETRRRLESIFLLVLVLDANAISSSVGEGGDAG